MSDKPCTFLVHFDQKRYPIAVDEIKADLKYGDAAAKASALMHAMALIINGDTYHFRDLSIIIVRNVLPCAVEDLEVQKLVLLYLETVYKGDDVFGRVPPDMDLVRDYLRQNLLHRDDYARGLTLRFISRLAGHHDLLEPLVESVIVNLYHRKRFVRRHAYSAISAIYLRPKPDGRQLLPDDALDHVEHQLSFERDAAAMRNAFFTLCTCARERAVAYLLANADSVITEWPDIVQVVAITLIRRAYCCCCCCSAANKDDDQGAKLIGIIISLSARSNSNSVIYEAADALLSLCSDPVAVYAATNAYLKLLFSLIIDMDVKRTVLDRLLELGTKHNNFVKTIGSPNPNPNQKKVLLVELDTTKMHIDSVHTIANMMNVKSPNAEKLLLVEYSRKKGDKVEASNGRDAQLMGKTMHVNPLLMD